MTSNAVRHGSGIDEHPGDEDRQLIDSNASPIRSVASSPESSAFPETIVADSVALVRIRAPWIHSSKTSAAEHPSLSQNGTRQNDFVAASTESQQIDAISPMRLGGPIPYGVERKVRRVFGAEGYEKDPRNRVTQN